MALGEELSDSLGPEGCDFEVDTKSFRVRRGGRLSKSAEKLPRTCLPNGCVHDPQDLGNFTARLIEKSYLWAWAGQE